MPEAVEGLTYITDGQRHLVCLPYSIANLHLMASQLGIKRCWFHFPDHYDIPKRRVTEIEALCTIVTPQEIVYITGRKPRPLTDR